MNHRVDDALRANVKPTHGWRSPVTPWAQVPARIVNIGLTRASRDDMLLRHPYNQETKQMLERWIMRTV